MPAGRGSGGGQRLDGIFLHTLSYCLNVEPCKCIISVFHYPSKKESVTRTETQCSPSVTISVTLSLTSTPSHWASILHINMYIFSYKK